jgi:putative ABC transport system permease protein
VSGGVIDLSVWQLGAALLLVVVVVAISLRQALGLERDLVVGAVRTIAQLYLVGFILAAVFAAATWYWVVLILLAMTAVATHAAVSRLGRPFPGASWIAATSLTLSTAATLAYVIGVVVQVRPWRSAIRSSWCSCWRRRPPAARSSSCGSPPDAT